MDHDDGFLLRQFVRRRDQVAFAELVRRHIDMVHAAARRQSDDAAGAEDITQSVFILLAQRARTIRDGRALPGWLLVTTRYAALNARRTEARRRRYETAAAMNNPNRSEPPQYEWECVGPLLDQAVAQLKHADRDAITLRYFKGQSMSEVAAALGVTEQAAQKRVGRAIERLRALLRPAGVTGSSEALASLFSVNLICSTVPAHLTAQVAAAASATTTSTSASVGVLMATAKAKVAAALIALTAVSAVAVPIAYRASTRASDAKPSTTTFDDLYALSPGQNVKLVRPPLLPERDRVLLDLPGRAFDRPPTSVLFEWNGTTASWQYATHGGPMTLADSLRQVLDIWVQDTEVPRELIGRPLPGDWVCRAGTSRDERLKDFCRDASTLIGNDMMLKLEPVEREAIVVSGKIDFQRTKARRPDEIGNQITFVEQGPPDESEHTVGQSPRQMLQLLGMMMARPVVIEPGTEVDQPKQPFFISTYGSSDFSQKLKVPDAAVVDPILARVAEQTGLQLKREPRSTPTWRLVRIPATTRQASLNAAYFLAGSESLKRVMPPFPEERRGIVRESKGQQPRSALFGSDGTTLDWRVGWFVPRDLGNVMKEIVGVSPQDTDLPRELWGKEVSGDWIRRTGATQEQLLNDLARAVSDVVEQSKTFKRETVEREAIVVSGEFRFDGVRPPVGEPGHNQITLYCGAAPAGSYSAIIARTPRGMLQWLGETTGRPIVLEKGARVDQDQEVYVLTYDSANFSRAAEPPDGPTVDDILARVITQTSLNVRRERAMVPTWRLVDR